MGPASREPGKIFGQLRLIGGSRMKSPAESSAETNYPHIVVRYAPRSFLQKRILVEPGSPHAAVEPCVLLRHPKPFDRSGRLSSEARELLIAAAAAPGAIGRPPYLLCFVWGLDECTFVDSDGGRVDSDHPPYVRPFYVDLGAALPPLPLERCFSIEVPAGNGEPSKYICAQRIGRLVEIVEGEQMVLGHLPDEEIPVGRDGFELPDADVLRMLPKTYRGAPITGYVAGGLLGPVQPMELATPIILQDPWPEEVGRACEQITGHPLPTSLKNAVWEAVCHRRPTLLRAA
jgi:hypothetical protein